MNHELTTWADLIPKAVGVALRSTRGKDGRQLLPPSERDALADLATRMLLRFAGENGEGFEHELPPPALAARLVGSLRSAALLSLRSGRSVAAQAHGRASARAGDPIDAEELAAPDPFSASAVREEADAVLAALSARSREVLAIRRGERAWEPSIPERTRRDWTARAIAEAQTVLDARR